MDKCSWNSDPSSKKTLTEAYSGEATKGDCKGITNEVKENPQGLVSGKSKDKGVSWLKAWPQCQIRGWVPHATKNVPWNCQHKDFAKSDRSCFSKGVGTKPGCGGFKS